MSIVKIAIFASGSGSNAENIANYFKNSETEVSLILTNKPDAYVLERAAELKIKSMVFTKEMFSESRQVIDILTEHEIDLIVLAGFLWLIPPSLIEAFPDRIINIHPALLPKFGGKGMYGDRVHQAVKDHQEQETGITIHYVNEKYDDGAIIAQYAAALEPKDNVHRIAAKVHALEYKFFPIEIEKIAKEIRSKKI